MKTKMMRSAGILILALTMVTAGNAQPYNQGGRGLGPCGQGAGPNQMMHPGGPGYGYGPGDGFMANQQWLDLSEEQQEAFEALRLEHYKQMKPLRNQMFELRARQHTLMSEDPVDMKKVNKVIDEQTDLQNKIRKLQASHRVEMRSNLTDEQLMKLDQHRRFHHQRGFHRNDAGRGPRKGNL